MVSFQTPWKQMENLCHADVSRGYRMGPVAWSGLTVAYINFWKSKLTLPAQTPEEEKKFT